MTFIGKITSKHKLELHKLRRFGVKMVNVFNIRTITWKKDI